MDRIIKVSPISGLVVLLLFPLGSSSADIQGRQYTPPSLCF